ncbi:hypothetical protein JCM10212_006071 [Sporobolomyces blumeae]
MRRFPAPPAAHGRGPSAPLASDARASAVSTMGRGSRSSEAPMQYEWEKPRQFPTSPFVTAVATDGEPARKRTHYEAMDVDTPPRPTATGAGPANHELEPLSFDSKSFDPKRSLLGLDESSNGRDEHEVVMADSAEELVREGDDRNLRVTVRGGEEPENGIRRRKPQGANGRKGSHGKASKGRGGVTIETDDEEQHTTDDDEIGTGTGEGFLSVLQKRVGKRAGGEFSFQVHHHHAAPTGPTSSLGAQQASLGGTPHEIGHAPERWLQSNTPYVLLGYLQFGSLTLLAVLTLSLLVLFLYTLYTDIQARLASLTISLQAEILSCAKAYVDNRCEPATRIPAIERSCREWEECMNQEVVVGGKTRVVAETLAEIVNGFVDVISFKTMLFVILTLAITIYGSTAALHLLSSRASSHSPPSHLASTYPPYPPPYGLPYGAGQTAWVIENGGPGTDHGALYGKERAAIEAK